MFILVTEEIYKGSNETMTLSKIDKVSLLQYFFNSKKIIDHSKYLDKPFFSYGKVVYELVAGQMNLEFMIKK